ncbi:lipopolysaccharide/colanic/teichoic acid biosynthesis glycosyltransferase [Kribbella voronezhensis]|uniref:Lipopolysaccharide/colanic/teichoic acid biosynthesis glycosyltransferase n=1 Tax=Kribbella voronezhensis TaxID=2512212 RepID=A0A4R7SX36_9ACTN|nr:sugar transferase [Kribbella voronezhensis]TDU83930.1 lipopolysaccharide/colanic/teichoic acid biosynthesis glycosyltransferase [Kribbella voronezhensis]
MSQLTRTRSKASAGRSAYGIGAIRRTLDVVVVVLLSVVVVPIIAIVAIGILLTDGRPVFFRQSRVGENGRRFTLYKLRTMRVVASGPEVTATADVRITRLGGVLRRTAIDELPQLWHVLRGQMTLVGPRPESDALARRYPESCRPILLARPGLTGPAQLHYREKSAVAPPNWSDVEAYYLQVLVPLRVAADQEYLGRPTLRRTLHYLLLTALFVTGLADVQRSVGSQTASE